MLPPGPRGPATAQTLAWAFRPVPFMERAHGRFGDTFTVRLAQVGTFVFVSEPAELKRVFTAPPGLLRAGEANVRLEPVLGPRSVLLLDGAEHLRQRRLLLPPFHGERMGAYREEIRAVAARAAAGWPRGEPFALQPRFQAVTLEIILRLVFGVRDAGRLAALRRALVALLGAVSGPVALLPWLRRDLGPGSPWRRFLHARADADRLIFAELARRRVAPDLAERGDILSLLLAARHEDGTAMTDAELRDELMTLLVAGHETTATALAWAAAQLVRRPEALERLRAEARDGEGTTYAEAVTRETLRRRPPLPLVARAVHRPWTVGPWTVPPGALVAPCIYLAHHREESYPDPVAFRPERFLGRAPDTYAWLPFGGGVRRCLGASFAQLEMVEVLRAVAATVDLRPTGDPEPVGRRAIILAPRRGARVVGT
jgi:cytochrome P450